MDEDLSFHISADALAVIRAMRQTQTSVDQLAVQTAKRFGDMQRAGQSLANLFGGLFAGLSVGAVVGKLVGVQREFDVLNSSLITITGSSAAAEQEMRWIKEFAATTPFALTEVTQAFVKMKSLGLDASQQALESYGNTASAMGKNLNQLIETVADAATGEFERLKEFGIKASSEGNKVSLTFQGVTTTIGKNADEITGYLQKLGQNQFAGAMAVRAATLDGAISNLGDTWDQLFRTVNAGNAGTLISDSVKLASGAIGDATVVLEALNAATTKNAQDTGTLSTFQEALGIAFETVTVLGLELKYVLVQTGRELGALAAQAVAVATLDFAQAREIGRLARQDAEQSRQDLEIATRGVLQARQRAEELKQFSSSGAGSDAQARRAAAQAKTAADAERAARAAAAKAAADAAEAAKKANKELEEQRKLIAELNGIQPDYIEQLTRIGVLRAKATLNETEYVAAVEALIAKQPSSIALAKQQADLDKDRVETLNALAELERKRTETAEQTTNGLTEQNQALRDEIELIGLTERAQLGVLQARNEVIILTKEATLAELERASTVTGTQTRIEIALAEEIRLLRERAGLLNQKLNRTEAAEVYSNLQAEGKRFVEQLEQGLTDSLFRAFEAGRGFFSTLWDGIKNLFKTTVLKLVIQGVVGSVLGSVGLAGAQDSTGGSSGAGGLISTANTLKKIYESFTNGSAASIISAFGAGGFGGSAAGYSEIAFQFSSALADAGFYETAGLIADNAAILSQGAAVVGAALTAYSIVAAFDAGEYGKAIGTAIGYYFFGDLGGAIGGFLGGVVDDFFGGGGDNRGGDTHGGGVYSSNGGFLTNDAQVGAIFNVRGEAIKDLTDRADAQVSVLVGALAVSLQNAAANIDEILGTKALQEITLGLAIDLKGYGKDTLGYFNLVGADGQRVNYANRDLSSNPEEAFKELSDAAAQAILDGLRNAEIPNYARDIFSAIEKEAEDAKETLAGSDFLREFITKLREAEQFAKTLQGLPIDALNNISIEAAQSLAKLAGGIESLTSNLEGYLTNFYSEAELQASAFANLQNAFGQLEAAGAFTQTAEQYQRLLVEPTRASFRALVDAQDLNTEAGRRTYTALLALSGAVAGVLPPLGELDGVVGDLGLTAAGAAQILSQRTELEIRLLRLTGNEIAAVAREREIELASLDVSNRVLAQYAYSIEDAQAAVELATQAAAAQTEALEKQQSAQQQAMAAAQESVQRWMAIANDAGGLLNDIGLALGGGSNREAELLAALDTGTAEDRLSAARELFTLVTQTGDAQTQQQQQALQNAQTLLAYGRSLRGFVDGLLVGDLTALTPEQQLAEAQRQYETTLAQAQAGNADAQRQLEGTARTYLQLSREFSPEAYATAIFPAVTDQIGRLGDSIITEAQAAAAMQQALLDAAMATNGLNEEQLAKLNSLQSVVQGFLAEAQTASAAAMAQEAIAQAQLSAIADQIALSRAAEAGSSGAVLEAQNRLIAVQMQAAAHLAIIAAASGTANRTVTDINGQEGRLSPTRAADIQAFVASLPQTDASIPIIIQAAIASGVTSSELDAALGLAPGLSAAGAARFGLPAFAGGGDFGGGIRIVGEDGPEVELTGPSRIFSAAQTRSILSGGGNDNTEVVAELKAVREELRQLREDQNAGRSAQLSATSQQTAKLESAMVEGPSRAGRQRELAAVKAALV